MTNPIDQFALIKKNIAETMGGGHIALNVLIKNYSETSGLNFHLVSNYLLAHSYMILFIQPLRSGKI